MDAKLHPMMTSLGWPRRSRLIIIGIVGSCAILLLMSLSSMHQLMEGSRRTWSTIRDKNNPAQDQQQSPEPKQDLSPYNSTLGFGEIKFISMPQCVSISVSFPSVCLCCPQLHTYNRALLTRSLISRRSDRRDAIELLASYTNLNMTWAPGVDGDTVTRKARPYDGHKLSAPTIGCWRAHANIWRQLLDAPYSTALILEDDIDWDIKTRDIMALVGEHMKAAVSSAMGSSSSITSSGPYYHEHWDTLWVGACLSEIPGDVRKSLTVYKDPYAPTAKDLKSYDREYMSMLGVDYPETGPGMRALHHAQSPTCTYGYAVSKKGAQRLLYNVGYRGLDAPVDLIIGNAIRSGRLNGMIVWPPVFTRWSVGGSKDSDISATHGKDKGNLHGRSQGLRRSARKAMIKEFEKRHSW
jgi:GR25 family glycosyltransferase involved in LPS biosynthesis